MNRSRRSLSAAWLRLATLAICLTCAAPLMGQTDNRREIARLAQELNAAYDTKAYAKAIEAGLKIEALDPANSGNFYNMACCYALSGDAAGAVKYLQKAADNGFDDAAHARSDADLASIRERPEFSAAIQTMERRAAESAARFQELAAKSEPLIVVPEGLDRAAPAPAIVALHGYGQRAEWIVEQWKEAAAAAGAILIAPRAVHASGSGFQWGRPEEAEHLVREALRKAADAGHKLDAKRIVLTGFSQGGFMTYCVGLRNSDLFCGLIPVAARFDPVAAAPLESRAGSRLPRVYVMVGTKDQVFEQSKTAHAALTKAGAECRLNEYADVGHTFPPNRLDEQRKALEWMLKN